MNDAPSLEVGDYVIKNTGDYEFEGTIRAVVIKGNGTVRYVVEDYRGLLFIFRAEQLKKVGSS